MKIAMMTNSYMPYIAGVPVSIERLSKGLRANGHEVVVFAPSYQEQGEESGVVRYRSLVQGVANGFSVPDILDTKIEREFREGGFDVIHVHHPMLIGNLALYLSRKYDVPLCFTYHTQYEQYLHYVKASFLKKAVPAYVNYFTRQCDMVLAPTPSMQAYLSELSCKANIAVLPTGIALENFEADVWEAKKLRKELLHGKSYLFCTVARLAKEKNIEFLFRSLSRRKTNRAADFRFAVIGEGPYGQYLKELAREQNLEEEVVFVGKVANEKIKNYCKAADLFLFSSQSETQGIVLLEAMAAALPVLAVRAPGVRDIVVNGKNGYMTNMSEIEYERRLHVLLQQDRSYLERGAIETAKQYEMYEIAKWAAVYYNIAIQNHRQAIRCGETGGKTAWKHFIF